MDICMDVDVDKLCVYYYLRCLNLYFRKNLAATDAWNLVNLACIKINQLPFSILL